MFQNRFKKRIVEYQNDLISQHCAEVENIYRQMRSWKHDYHNHLQAIKAYIALGHINELSEYCDKIEQDLHSIDQIIKTGNIMLDSILNSKISLAIHREIEVNAKATVPQQLNISDVDLCVLIGNLLDNAIEACDKDKKTEDTDAEHSFIRIYIGTKGHQLYICVTNTAYGKPTKIGSHFLSTKSSSSHGFGLERIDKICSRYEGYCKRNSEPGAFSTEILLPVC